MFGFSAGCSGAGVSTTTGAAGSIAGASTTIGAVGSTAGASTTGAGAAAASSGVVTTIGPTFVEDGTILFDSSTTTGLIDSITGSAITVGSMTIGSLLSAGFSDCPGVISIISVGAIVFTLGTSSIIPDGSGEDISIPGKAPTGSLFKLISATGSEIVVGSITGFSTI